MIFQAEDISYSASGNLRDKQPQRCDPCKNVNHVNDVDNFTPLVKILSMKFSKPKILLENNYPDLEISQPDLIRKLIKEYVYPPEKSIFSEYYNSTIEFLKEKLRSKNKKVQVNLAIMKSYLYFTKICFKNKYGSHKAINALFDTGAVNSLIHKSVVRRLNLDFEPLSMRLCIASGFNEHAIIGKSHVQFILHSKDD